MSKSFITDWEIWGRLCDLPQLCNSAAFHPLNNENVAFMIEAGSMRANETSGRERARSQISNRAPVLHRVVALSETGHYFVLTIENDYFAQQVRDHHIAIPFM